MNSPLCREEFFEERFFVVAVPLKPYYNTVNLEKAGTCVKQKEFIQRISPAEASAPAAHQRGGTPRRHFFLGVARLGSLGPRLAAPHAQPLSPFHRIRGSPVATRDFPAPRARPQSRRHRSRAQPPGRCRRSSGEQPPARAALPPLADSPRPLACPSGSRCRSFHRFP